MIDAVKKDRRRDNFDDRLKHIVDELNIANSAIQLAMCDLSHFMKDLQGVKEAQKDEHSPTD